LIKSNPIVLSVRKVPLTEDKKSVTADKPDCREFATVHFV